MIKVMYMNKSLHFDAEKGKATQHNSPDAEYLPTVAHNTPNTVHVIV